MNLFKLGAKSVELFGVENDTPRFQREAVFLSLSPFLLIQVYSLFLSIMTDFLV